MRPTVKNISRKANGDREPFFKSGSDDEFIENNLRHRVRKLETHLFEEYCSEFASFQVRQLCSRR